VLLVCFSSSCVACVASFSGLSIYSTVSDIGISLSVINKGWQVKNKINALFYTNDDTVKYPVSNALPTMSIKTISK
jgi:hypothetical protein